MMMSKQNTQKGGNKKKKKGDNTVDKKWLKYISEGPQVSFNTTGEANFISSKNRKKLQSKVSVNS